MPSLLNFASRVERRIVLMVLIAGVLPLTLMAVLAMREIESQTLELAQRQLRESTKTYALDLLDQLDQAENELRIRHLSGLSDIPGGMVTDLRVIDSDEPLERTVLVQSVDSLIIKLPFEDLVLIGTIGYDRLFKSLGHVPYGVSRCVEISGISVRCEGTPMRGDTFSASWELPLTSVYATDFQLTVSSSELNRSALNHVSLISRMLPLAMLAFAAIIAWTLMLQIRRRVAPLSVLWEATQSVRNGDFSTRLEIRTGDEFERLGQGFNLMTERLEGSFSKMQAMSEIDRLILSGSSVEDITRHALLVAGRNCRKTCYVYRWGTEPGTGQLYEIVEASLTVKNLNFALCREGNNDTELTDALERTLGYQVVAGFQILKDGVAAGTLFATGEGDLTTAEKTTLSELADRISVAATNAHRADALYRQANYDMLTGLINRQAFSDRLSERIESSRRSGIQGALLFLDLDQFKQVNDTKGHQVGDKLLRAVAQRLVSSLRTSDVVARLGGDEFAVIMSEYSSQSELTMLCRRVISAVEEPIEIDQTLHEVSVSVGVSVFPDDGLDSGSLLMKADVAMYKAKEKKGSTFTFFDQSLNDAAEQRAQIESRLRKAISEEILQVHFQPKLHLPSGQIHNVEALLRWPEGNGSFFSPAKFIPVAEETGLVHTFTNLLVAEAAQCLKEVRRKGLRLDRVAINISTQQFVREKFADEFLNAIAHASIKTEDMEIEITESLFIENAEHVTRQLRKLQAAGVHIALDDFGTGFSSLNMLRTLPLNTVKIDRSFITPMTTSKQGRDLAEKIIEIAATLELEVVAEGVELDAETDLLRRFGCDYIQGFILTQALPIDQLVTFLTQHHEQLHMDNEVVPIRS